MGVSAFHKSLWPEVARRYEGGEEMKSIAEDLGIDRKTVYNVARRAGLPNRHVFDEERTARILKAYEAGTPGHEIASTENVHRAFISKVARKAGLPPRPVHRRYPLNESAFDNPTPVGWWLIGLLAAGTLAVMQQCSEFWGDRLSFQRVDAPTVYRHIGALHALRLHGVNAGRAARTLLASSPISLQRKRRTLEAIVSITDRDGPSTPPRMRTSENSNKRSD